MHTLGSPPCSYWVVVVVGGAGRVREWTFVPLCFTENLGKQTQQSNFTSPLTFAGGNAQVFAHQPPKVLRCIPV